MIKITITVEDAEKNLKTSLSAQDLRILDILPKTESLAIVLRDLILDLYSK